MTRYFTTKFYNSFIRLFTNNCIFVGNRILFVANMCYIYRYIGFRKVCNSRNDVQSYSLSLVMALFDGSYVICDFLSSYLLSVVTLSLFCITTEILALVT